MRYDPQKKLTVKEVGELIAAMYPSYVRRRLFIHKSRCDNTGRVGAVFFALEGSPPKGFAIYRLSVTDNFLLLIDAWGKKRKMLENVEITDLDEYGDFATLAITQSR